MQNLLYFSYEALVESAHTKITFISVPWKKITMNRFVYNSGDIVPPGDKCCICLFSSVFFVEFNTKCYEKFSLFIIYQNRYVRNQWTQNFDLYHYCDVIMGAVASQITSLMIVYSSVHSDADQRKHQSSASLAFVRGIHRWPVNSPHKWPVTRKCFHLMTSSCLGKIPMKWYSGDPL